jgi:hypothetical protein
MSANFWPFLPPSTLSVSNHQHKVPISPLLYQHLPDPLPQYGNDKGQGYDMQLLSMVEIRPREVVKGV